MPPRNASELQRLTEEREDLLNMIKNGYLSKGSKAYYLEELRKVDRQLGVDSGDYNSSSFGRK